MKLVVIELRGRTVVDSIAQSFEVVKGGASKIEVLLSGALARPFMFGPVVGLKGWREAHTAARAAAPAACGIDAPCDVQLESDPSSAPTLATAVASTTLDAIYSTADALGLRVNSVRPLWAWALDQQSGGRPHASSEVSSIVFCDADSQTLVTYNDGRWLYAASQVHESLGEQALTAWLRRVQLASEFDWRAARIGRLDAGSTGRLEGPTVLWAGRSMEEAV